MGESFRGAGFVAIASWVHRTDEACEKWRLRREGCKLRPGSRGSHLRTKPRPKHARALTRGVAQGTSDMFPAFEVSPQRPVAPGSQILFALDMFVPGKGDLKSASRHLGWWCAGLGICLPMYLLQEPGLLKPIQAINQGSTAETQKRCFETKGVAQNPP